MTTLVRIIGKQYARFVGRIRTHKFEVDTPLTQQQITELINDPVQFESAFEITEGKGEGSGPEAA